MVASSQTRTHPDMPIAKLAPGPGESFDADGKPPPFGHALKHYFALDEEYVNLNHGKNPL